MKAYPLNLHLVNFSDNAIIILDITCEMRLLKGQTVLENNKTIPDLQLTDGSTLHMVLEPAKDIEVTIKLPSMPERKFTFSNNFTPSKLLQHLQNEGLVFRPPEDYYLLLSDKELPNDIPLHSYSMTTAIKIQRVTIGLQIIDEYNEKLYVTVNPKTDTILDVKKRLIGRWGDYKNIKVYDKLDQTRIFIAKNKGYHLLKDNCSIKDCGVENEGILYMIYYDWDPAQNTSITFYIGQWNLNGEPRNTQKTFDFVGRTSVCGRTALSLALRIQDQYDIPAQDIAIYSIHQETVVYREMKSDSVYPAKKIMGAKMSRLISKIKLCQFNNVLSKCDEFVIFFPPGSQIVDKQVLPLTEDKTYTLSIVEKYPHP